MNRVNPDMNYLVTGAAGFIGFHVAKRLLEQGHNVTGIDNLNDYYNVPLKQDRLALLEKHNAFTFHNVNLEDKAVMAALFDQFEFDYVIHLGAQAGVRYSIDNPHAYGESNLIGHLNVLEGCRLQWGRRTLKHLVYASSSSVYGMNTVMPFKVSDSVDHPVSLYAATKKANELMSHSYSHLYGLPVTGLRFFTVYGPWGRPDMAPIKFARAIMQGDSIQVNNNGDMARDFTYIDDIVEGVVRICDVQPEPIEDWTQLSGDASNSSAPYRLYNIGAGQPVNLLKFIETLETALGQKARKRMAPMQPGDVHKTWADTEDLFKATGYRPQVTLEEGIAKFAEWFKTYEWKPDTPPKEEVMPGEEASDDDWPEGWDDDWDEGDEPEGTRH